MKYERAKELIIGFLDLELLYSIENIDVYKNENIIVEFVTESSKREPLIRADYLKLFDRWSVATYGSDFKFSGWLDVVIDLVTFDRIWHNVIIEEDGWFSLLDNDEYDKYFRTERTLSRNNICDFLHIKTKPKSK